MPQFARWLSGTAVLLCIPLASFGQVYSGCEGAYCEDGGIYWHDESGFVEFIGQQRNRSVSRGEESEKKSEIAAEKAKGLNAVGDQIGADRKRLIPQLDQAREEDLRQPASSGASRLQKIFSDPYRPPPKYKEAFAKLGLDRILSTQKELYFKGPGVQKQLYTQAKKLDEFANAGLKDARLAKLSGQELAGMGSTMKERREGLGSIASPGAKPASSGRSGAIAAGKTEGARPSLSSADRSPKVTDQSSISSKSGGGELHWDVPISNELPPGLLDPANKFKAPAEGIVEAASEANPGQSGLAQSMSILNSLFDEVGESKGAGGENVRKANIFDELLSSSRGYEGGRGLGSISAQPGAGEESLSFKDEPKIENTLFQRVSRSISRANRRGLVGNAP